MAKPLVFLNYRMHISQRILYNWPKGIILRTSVLAFLCCSSRLFRGLVSLGGSIRKYNKIISSIFQDIGFALWQKRWIIFKYMSTSWPCVLNLNRNCIAKDLVLLIQSSEWPYVSSKRLSKLQKNVMPFRFWISCTEMSCHTTFCKYRKASHIFVSRFTSIL